MRYELTDYEWSVIRPMRPNKPRGVPRVDDRRVLNGVFWIWRSGAPWRNLPKSYGPKTTCNNRFVRWWQAGVWDQITDALASAHDAAVLMIDTSIVRVHQHGSCIAGNSEQHMGRSRGGLTSKIHAVRGRSRKQRGQTFRPNAMARSKSASALISTERATRSSGSSIRIKQCRHVASRYDKLAANYLAFIKLASIRIWPRVYEFAP